MVSQEDILKPLIFLDIFDYPPTAMELWRFLPVQAELGEVINIPSSFVIPTEARLARSGGIPLRDPSPSRLGMTTKNGCHFLPGREELVNKRREFFYLSEKKFKIARRAAWLLHFIPSIGMIAVCNNFYYRPQSDIDFFIIAQKGRLWLTRFFATMLLDLFNLRARGKKTADRICLSFYLSEDNLNLENIALKPEDPYLSYWLAFLEPIYGQECYNKFWEANGWLKNIFPNILPKQPVARRCLDGVKNLTHPVRAARPPLPRRGIFLGDWLEKIAKKIQWQKLSPRVKEMAAAGDTRVVINEQMLKFHENDRREFYREELRVKREKIKEKYNV